MEDIYALLNINRNLIQDFPLKANNIVDHQTELAINRTMRSLREIEERMMSDKFVKVSQQTIDEIMQKVMDNADINNQDMSIWSIRELRIVSYYQMKLQGNDQAYMYALELIEKGWRDMFFNGLSFYCLDNWNMIDPQFRNLTCDLLRKKLSSYQDGNKKYVVMKNHANLFDEAGPFRMSALISQKKQELNEAPSYFGNKSTTINQSYYSDVIVNYCNSNNVRDLDIVDTIFEIHNLERTKKLVLADLVNRVNDSGDELERTKLCKFANRLLGDVTLGSTWAPFFGATDEDAQKLKKAKQLVNLWFNQRIIETFFEVCVQDRSRKDFWLKYVDKFSSFRIVGSTSTKRLLQADSRISGMFLKYFRETDSYTSQTSALVLFIKNKMLVEFSDTGALYAYNKGHKMVKRVLDRRISISTTNDLKIPSMINLIDTGSWGYYNYYEEGRMTHQGDWQSRLSGWMQQMLLSLNNSDISSFDSEDNDLFKAKPVPKEDIKPSKVAPTVNKTTSPVDVTSKEDHQTSQMRDSFDDVPEQKIQEKPSQPMQPAGNKLCAVDYEERVSYTIASKWLYGGKCRVVSNSKGFYIEGNKKYVFISEPVGITPTQGNLWIKKPNSDGWWQIVHAYSNNEISVGYIKLFGNGIHYKRHLIQYDSMNIKLY